jgi:hypothetical protein
MICNDFQFVAVMLHGFQLAFYDDCGFPWKFSYYIAAHAALFFVLFSKFYLKAYIRPKKQKVSCFVLAFVELN